MKGKVIKPFIDKYTQKGYSEGDVYDSNDSERIAFLHAEGYLSVPEQPKEQVKKNAPKRKNSPKNKS